MSELSDSPSFTQSPANGSAFSPAPRDGGLVDFVANVVGEGPLRVEESLGGGYVRLRVSEAERRQAKHDIRSVEDAVIELLRNSRDAGATRVFLATAREGDRRWLLCIDDGDGIPPSMHARVFEARVTSKLDSVHVDTWGVHGRGMALFSISQNFEEAGVVCSDVGRGTSIRLVCDCTSLTERADQHTWPQVARGEDGGPRTGRGPHNIARIVSDFALDSHPGVEVFFGSATEVLAALVCQGLAAREACDKHGGDPGGGAALDADRESPYWLLPSLASDARALMEAAAAIGLPVSERTCYRVLNGEIPGAPSVYERLLPDAGGTRRPVDLLRDRRSLKVSKRDLEDFSETLEDAFRVLGERYYLSLRSRPEIRVSHDSVTVTFPISKDE